LKDQLGSIQINSSLIGGSF